MLLADKTVGRYIPVRFISFSLIGGVGVVFHMTMLSLLIASSVSFHVAQISTTIVTMVLNFALNNLLTYRDQRLRGINWLRGLVAFMFVCSIGAVANIGVADYLFAQGDRWALAALAGIMISATWNYAVTKLYTWNQIGKS